MDDIADIIAENEAAAEAEEPLETGDPEDDTAAEPVPLEDHANRVAAAETAVDMAEREKQLRREDTRHENALKRLYGDEFAEHAFCPLCLGQGFLVPIAAGAQPDEVWEAITALSGRMASGEYSHPDELQVCARCDGYGQVATGAKNDHNALIPCSLCDGRGFHNLSDPMHRGRLNLPPEQIVVAPAPVFAPLPVAVGAPNGIPVEEPQGWTAAGKPGVDGWGRWPGHPRYGIDPTNGGW